jgi:hypothetical protein
MLKFRSLAVLAVVGAVTAVGGTATAAPHLHPTTKHHGPHLHPGQKGYSASKSVTPEPATSESVAATQVPDAPAPTGADSNVTTVRVPQSIDASGNHDVTQQLNAFLAQVPDNSVVAFPTNGRFRIDDVVSLSSKTNVTLEGNGSTLFASTQGYRERNLLTVNGGSDLTIRDFHLVGAHPDAGADGTYVSTLEGQHGIRLLGPQRVLIENNTIKNVYGDFVYLSCDLRKKLPTWREPSRDVTIRDNQLSSNGRQGVSFINADRVLVQNNVIDDVKRTVFDFEPTTSSALVQNVTIDHNAVGDHHLNFVSGGGNGTTDDVMVSNNTLHGSAMNSMIKNRLGETRSNWNFVGNTSDRGFGSTLKAVVVAYGATGIQFSDNVQPMNRRPLSQGAMAGLRTVGGCGAVATGNDLGPYGGAQMIGDSGTCSNLSPLGKVATPAAVGSVS